MTGQVSHHASVFGVDEQDDEDIDVARWVTLAESVLEAEHVPRRGELSVLFVDETTMADLNARHMGATGPTDVLAFPLEAVPPGVGPRETVPLDTVRLEERLEPGRWPDNGTTGPDRPFPEPDDMPLLLGDVVVCPSVAARQAPEHAGGPHHDGRLVDELALLVVHGVLHVLGMDHAEPAGTEAMQTRERELLGRFHTTP